VRHGFGLEMINDSSNDFLKTLKDVAIDAELIRHRASVLQETVATLLQEVAQGGQANENITNRDDGVTTELFDDELDECCHPGCTVCGQ
jgi:hypothetical protein